MPGPRPLTAAGYCTLKLSIHWNETEQKQLQTVVKLFCINFISMCGQFKSCMCVYHTRTVERECFKGHDLHKNWYAWLGPGQHPACKIMVSAPQIRNFAVPLGWLVFSSFFGFFNKATTYTPERILGKMRQKTSFQIWKCLLGVPITIFDIYTLKLPKTAIYGADFDWTWFFCGGKSH